MTYQPQTDFGTPASRSEDQVTLTIDGRTTTTYAYFLTEDYPYVPRCFTHAPDVSFDRAAGGGGGGGRGRERL